MGPDQLTVADPAVPGRAGRAFTPVFAVLDPLRAVGALAVLVTHATFWTGDYVRHGVLGSVLARLDVGVAIFFVLSGFLLSHHYFSRAWNREPAEPAGRYFWKRFLRIYPAYVVAVVVAMVFVKDNSYAGPGDWATVLLMGDIYATDTYRPGLTQMWSLATEVSFYVVLPLLMLAATGRSGPRPRTRRVAGVVGAMVVLNVLWTLGLQQRVHDSLGTGVPATGCRATSCGSAPGSRSHGRTCCTRTDVREPSRRRSPRWAGRPACAGRSRSACSSWRPPRSADRPCSHRRPRPRR